MATMKTLNGYGFDSAKLGGRAPEYYTNPRNLLYNSDFTNPVNQRGQTTYNAGGYTIDGWSIWSVNGDASLTLVEGGIAFNPGTGNGTLTQKLPLGLLDSAKTYTLAIHKSNGETQVRTDGVAFNHNGNGDLITISTAQETIVWAALYEGSYTADNVPPPFLYPQRLEMLNLGLPVQPRNLLDNSDFRNPVNQRGKTSYTAQGYTIDRWYSNNANKAITLSNTGITLSTGSTLFQKLDLIDALAGKTITAAVCFADGTIAAKSGISTNNGAYTSIVDVTQNNLRIRVYEGADGYIRFQFEPNANIKLQWAALYEGSYTADTLPPYVSKGYTAELAECRRYFRRYAADNASLILSGFVTGGAKDISVHAPELAPMRTKNVSIAYSGSGVIIRGVSGYASECSGTSPCGDISISPYQKNSSFCASIDIYKKDGTEWGLTNNTPVVVNFAPGSILDYIADL